MGQSPVRPAPAWWAPLLLLSLLALASDVSFARDRPPRRVWLTLGPVASWERFPGMDAALGFGGSFGFIADPGGLELTVVQSKHDMHPMSDVVPGTRAEYLVLTVVTKVALLRRGPVRPYVGIGASLIDFTGRDGIDLPGLSGDLALHGRALLAKVGADVPLGRWLALDLGATVRRVADMESDLGFDFEQAIGGRLEGTATDFTAGLVIRL